MARRDRIGGHLKNSKTEKILHYIYYLYDISNKIAYVGKSWNVNRRHKEALKRYTELLTVQIGKSFDDITKACAFEKSEIARLRPRLNKRISSSPSSFGMRFTQSVQHTENIRKGKLGKKRPPFSAEWLKNLSLSHMGNTALLGFKFSEASKQKMRESQLGREHSEATKQKMRDTWARRKEEKLLLQSGYGHPWRIKDLGKATQEVIA